MNPPMKMSKSDLVFCWKPEEVDEQYSWSFGCHAEFWSFGCHAEFLENRRHDQEYHSISFSSANCVLLYLTKKKILIDAESDQE